MSDPSTAMADDYALMAQIAARDRSGFSALYDRHSGAVHALCLRMLGDAGEAEDLLIDIFWEIWDRPDRYDSNRGSPIGYLMGVARSRAVDRLRSRRSRAKVGTDYAGAAEARAMQSASPAPAAQAMAAEQQARLTEAMANLPPEQRQALEMAYFDAMTHAQMAAKLNEPLGTVKSRIRQAMLRLREVLGREH